LSSSKILLDAMKVNDEKVKEEIDVLKKIRRDNSELSYSLTLENQQNLKKNERVRNIGKFEFEMRRNSWDI